MMPAHLERPSYFRVTIDVATWSRKVESELASEIGSTIADEHLGKAIERAILSGELEVDAANSVEDHRS